MKRFYRKKVSVFLVFMLLLSQFAVFPHVGYAAASLVQSLAGGNYHSLAVKSDGTLWAWGYNGSGRLGDGTTTSRYTPVQVLSDVRAIAAGTNHSLARKSDGTLWAWGYNGSGQLGDGTTIDRHTPVQVLSDVQAIAAGGSHSLALKSDGTLWAWGYNGSGQLGDGTTTNSSTPVQVQGLSGVQAIVAVNGHSLALKSDGTLWAWGNNAEGQLGDGTITDRITPVQVQSLSDVQAIAAGGYHSLARKSDGTLWAWGYNGDGELGDGTTTNSSTPVQVQGLSGVQAIVAVNGHSLARKSDGTLWAWGYNAFGQLGDGTTINRSTPVQVQDLSDVQAIAAGYFHSLARKSDGTLWAWGNNGEGQLGDGTTTSSSTPIAVVFPQTDAEAVAADKAALAIGYASGDSAAGVTQGVTLPASGASGTAISWTSDNTAVIDGSGSVNRPGYSAGDVAVTLTATISKGAESATQMFPVTVTKLAQTDAEAVATDKAALAIGYASGDSAAGVTQNVTLPTSGASGTVISWISDSLAIYSSGAVTRPSYTQGDATVTLTATIVSTNGTVSDTKVFTVTLTKLAQSDTEAVATDKAALAIGYASGDSAAGVTQNVTLPTSGASGTTISWTSDNAAIAVSGGSGAVTRPSFSAGDAGVALTATISKGAATDTRIYVLTVNAQEGTAASSPGPTSTGGISDSSTDFRIIINGKEHGQIVKEAVTEESQQDVLTLTVDASRLADLLAKEVDKSTVIIPAALSENAEEVTVELTGDAVKAMENKQADLEVQTANGNYKLPAAQVFIDQVASQLGGQAKLSDIVIHVSIAKSDAEKVKLVESTAEKDKFTVVLPPVDFTVTASYNGQTVEVDKFSSYVEREIPLPDGIDPSKVTTAAVLAADGTLHHVPTYVTLRDGKYYAVVNSLTNSTYTLIWHPMTFEDVSGHWAKNAVNDMASRMVVKGVDATHYNPDAAITRAEFAAIIMRAAGLAEGQQTLMFRDVNAGDWYASAVAIAQEYGIIAGYGDGTFRPNQTISREEAMVMVARAMKLAGLSANVSDAESESILASFTDKAGVNVWAKQAVAATVKYGLVTGSETGLQPSRNITRAETAVIVQRMLVKAKLIDSKNS